MLRNFDVFAIFTFLKFLEQQFSCCCNFYIKQSTGCMQFLRITIFTRARSAQAKNYPSSVPVQGGNDFQPAAGAKKLDLECLQQGGNAQKQRAASGFSCNFNTRAKRASGNFDNNFDDSRSPGRWQPLPGENFSKKSPTQFTERSDAPQTANIFFHRH